MHHNLKSVEESSRQDWTQARSLNRQLKTEVDIFKQNLSMKVDSYKHENMGLNREIDRNNKEQRNRYFISIIKKYYYGSLLILNLGTYLHNLQ